MEDESALRGSKAEVRLEYLAAFIYGKVGLTSRRFLRAFWVEKIYQMEKEIETRIKHSASKTE